MAATIPIPYLFHGTGMHCIHIVTGVYHVRFDWDYWYHAEFGEVQALLMLCIVSSAHLFTNRCSIAAGALFGFALLFSQAADANIWNALGFALIGGLLTSTVLVLTVTPALYYLFERPSDARTPRLTERTQRLEGAEVAGAAGR